MAPHFHFVTLFPEVVEPWLTTGILGRAHDSGVFRYTIHPLRDFTQDRHRTVDDIAYGGGGGMVLKVEPLVRAVEAIIETHLETHSGNEFKVVVFSPAGKRLTQSLIESEKNNLPSFHYILICGRYEGIDQRFIDGWANEVVSLGEFVITGGELPALCYTDALVRQLDGTVAHDSGCRNESFCLQDELGNRLLEYPHYTRPAVFRGAEVPQVLLGGDHKAIERWRLERAKEITRGNKS